MWKISCARRRRAGKGRKTGLREVRVSFVIARIRFPGRSPAWKSPASSIYGTWDSSDFSIIYSRPSPLLSPPVKVGVAGVFRPRVSCSTSGRKRVPGEFVRSFVRHWHKEGARARGTATGTRRRRRRGDISRGSFDSTDRSEERSRENFWFVGHLPPRATCSIFTHVINQRGCAAKLAGNLPIIDMPAELTIVARCVETTVDR